MTIAREDVKLDQPALATSAALARNDGTALELDWVEAVRVNRSAVERRAATLTTRRSVKKEWQAAWLLKAVTLIDLTTLSGDDTAGRVRRLCAKALQPVRQDLLDEPRDHRPRPGRGSSRSMAARSARDAERKSRSARLRIMDAAKSSLRSRGSSSSSARRSSSTSSASSGSAPGSPRA